MQRAILYILVSTEEHADGSSLAFQEGNFDISDLLRSLFFNLLVSIKRSKLPLICLGRLLQKAYYCADSGVKKPIFFPLYNIHSQLVKAALGLKDNRSIEKFFHEAGIKIIKIGKKKCVTYDDLMAVVKRISPTVVRYEAKSDLSKEIDAIE